MIKNKAVSTNLGVYILLGLTILMFAIGVTLFLGITDNGYNEQTDTTVTVSTDEKGLTVSPSNYDEPVRVYINGTFQGNITEPSDTIRWNEVYTGTKEVEVYTQDEEELIFKKKINSNAIISDPSIQISIVDSSTSLVSLPLQKQKIEYQIDTNVPESNYNVKASVIYNNNPFFNPAKNIKVHQNNQTVSFETAGTMFGGNNNNIKIEAILLDPYNGSDTDQRDLKIKKPKIKITEDLSENLVKNTGTFTSSDYNINSNVQTQTAASTQGPINIKNHDKNSRNIQYEVTNISSLPGNITVKASNTTYGISDSTTLEVKEYKVVNNYDGELISAGDVKISCATSGYLCYDEGQAASLTVPEDGEYEVTIGYNIYSEGDVEDSGEHGRIEYNITAIAKRNGNTLGEFSDTNIQYTGSRERTRVMDLSSGDSLTLQVSGTMTGNGYDSLTESHSTGFISLKPKSDVNHYSGDTKPNEIVYETSTFQESKTVTISGMVKANKCCSFKPSTSIGDKDKSSIVVINSNNGSIVQEEHVFVQSPQAHRGSFGRRVNQAGSFEEKISVRPGQKIALESGGGNSCSSTSVSLCYDAYAFSHNFKWVHFND